MSSFEYCRDLKIKEVKNLGKFKNGLAVGGGGGILAYAVGSSFPLVGWAIGGASLIYAGIKGYKGFTKTEEARDAMWDAKCEAKHGIRGGIDHPVPAAR
jgi:hypothetical protein